jgi:hypothetical protein
MKRESTSFRPMGRLIKIGGYFWLVWAILAFVLPPWGDLAAFLIICGLWCLLLVLAAQTAIDRTIND